MIFASVFVIWFVFYLALDIWFIRQHILFLSLIYDVSN